MCTGVSSRVCWVELVLHSHTGQEETGTGAPGVAPSRRALRSTCVVAAAVTVVYQDECTRLTSSETAAAWCISRPLTAARAHPRTHAPHTRRS